MNPSNLQHTYRNSRAAPFSSSSGIEMNLASHASLLPLPCAYNYFTPPDTCLSMTTAQLKMQMISSINNMGVGCFEVSKFAEAGQCFLSAFERANELLFRSMSLKNNHLKSKLAKSLADKSLLASNRREEYDEGMHVFSGTFLVDLSMSIQDATGFVLFNLGQLCDQLGENDNALNFYLKALDYFADDTSNSKSFPRRVALTALLSNIGNKQYRLGQYEEAVISYSKTLRLIRGSVLAGNHDILELAATLNSLGVLYFHIPTVDCSKTMNLFLEALSIYRAVLGFDVQTKEIATFITILEGLITWQKTTVSLLNSILTRLPFVASFWATIISMWQRPTAMLGRRITSWGTWKKQRGFTKNSWLLQSSA